MNDQTETTKALPLGRLVEEYLEAKAYKAEAEKVLREAGEESARKFVQMRDAVPPGKRILIAVGGSLFVVFRYANSERVDVHPVEMGI